MSGEYQDWQEQTERRGRRRKHSGRTDQDWEDRSRSQRASGHRSADEGYGADGYGQQEGYPDGGWEAEPDGYRTDPQSQTDPYGGTGGYYDQPDPYSGQGGYASHEDYAGQGGYADREGYTGQGGYAAPDDYQGHGGYADPYAGADPYQAHDPYAGRSSYDDQAGVDHGGQYDGYSQDSYRQPAGYDAGSQPGYDYREDSYGGQAGYDRGGQYSDYTHAGSGPLPGSLPGERYATADDDPSDWRSRSGGAGASSDREDIYEPTSRRERRYQRGEAGQDGPVGGSRRSGRSMDADDDRHSGFFSGFASNDDDHYGKQPRRRRGLGAGTIALLIFLVVILGIGGVGYHYYSLYKSRHASYSGNGYGSVEVTVKPGDTGDSIASQLLSAGVIAAIDPWDAFVADKPSSLQPGEYKLHEHMGSAQAWAMLLNPKNKVNSNVTIIDGERYSVILTKLAAATHIPLSQFQAAIKDTKALGLPSYAHGNPEGYLYPDTYTFVPGSTTALQVLQQAVHEFTVQMTQLNLPAKAHVAQFTEAQIITGASLLEAEVGPQYYSKVARVIDNRLTAVPEIPLGLDSTIAYATGKYIYDLTTSDLNVNSPYNTRLHIGLPPGPIDSPDIAAIKAFLHPVHGPWLYFVTVNKKGLTLFTDSSSQFQIWSQEAKNNGL